MAAVVLRKVAEVLRFDCGQYTVSSRYICGFLRLSVVVNRREQRPEPYKWRETQSTKQSNVAQWLGCRSVAGGLSLIYA